MKKFIHYLFSGLNVKKTFGNAEDMGIDEILFIPIIVNIISILSWLVLPFLFWALPDNLWLAIRIQMIVFAAYLIPSGMINYFTEKEEK